MLWPKVWKLLITISAIEIILSWCFRWNNISKKTSSIMCWICIIFLHFNMIYSQDNHFLSKKIGVNSKCLAMLTKRTNYLVYSKRQHINFLDILNSKIFLCLQSPVKFIDYIFCTLNICTVHRNQRCTKDVLETKIIHNIYEVIFVWKNKTA